MLDTKKYVERRNLGGTGRRRNTDEQKTVDRKIVIRDRRNKYKLIGNYFTVKAFCKMCFSSLVGQSYTIIAAEELLLPDS